MTTEGQALDEAKIDHRGSGWTLWREVYGTFIGVLPLILAISAAAITVIRDNDRHEIEIRTLKETDLRHEGQLAILRTESEKTRTEILSTLRDIAFRVEALQIQVAKSAPRT